MARKSYKHKETNKHALEYDVFFKGKKNQLNELDELFTYESESFDYKPGTIQYDEVYDNERYLKEKKLKEIIYEILVDKTDISFEIPRRKPPRDAFNDYFDLLVNNINKDENYKLSEIFTEFAHYFSDNLFSMFKLLENDYRNLIIKELYEHIGKQDENAKKVNRKNLKNGCEIEFIEKDEDREYLITGVIIEYDKLDGVYKVDSFENIYLVPIENITQILNTNNSKYNLNKLDNIDFL